MGHHWYRSCQVYYLLNISSLLQCRGVVQRCMFQPQQLMLITASEDTEVRVWDLVAKSCVAVLKVGDCTHYCGSIYNITDLVLWLS